MFEDILSATIRGATPLLLAALGEVISQRAGVLNIGIEGMMLTGAFFGMVGSFYTAELVMIAPWFGILMAGLSGLIAAALFALCAIRLRGDQVIIGTAMTLLALGLTEVVYQRLFGITGIAQGVPAFQQINIPLLSQIPFIGRALFSHNILVYIAFLLVPCVYFFLYHTQQGLRVRACGEHPRAIASAGANVLHLRTMCLLFAGAMAGIAGGYLSLADVPYFTPGMTVGRGFIALAIVHLWEMASHQSVWCSTAFRTRFCTRCTVSSIRLGYPVSGFFDVTLRALLGSTGRICRACRSTARFRKTLRTVR